MTSKPPLSSIILFFLLGIVTTSNGQQCTRQDELIPSDPSSAVNTGIEDCNPVVFNYDFEFDGTEVCELDPDAFSKAVLEFLNKGLECDNCLDLGGSFTSFTLLSFTPSDDCFARRNTEKHPRRELSGSSCSGANGSGNYGCSGSCSGGGPGGDRLLRDGPFVVSMNDKNEFEFSSRSDITQDEADTELIENEEESEGGRNLHWKKKKKNDKKRKRHKKKYKKRKKKRKYYYWKHWPKPGYRLLRDDRYEVSTNDKNGFEFSPHPDITKDEADTELIENEEEESEGGRNLHWKKKKKKNDKRKKHKKKYKKRKKKKRKYYYWKHWPKPKPKPTPRPTPRPTTPSPTECTADLVGILNENGFTGVTTLPKVVERRIVCDNRLPLPTTGKGKGKKGGSSSRSPFLTDFDLVCRLPNRSGTKKSKKSYNFVSGGRIPGSTPGNECFKAAGLCCGVKRCLCPGDIPRRRGPSKGKGKKG